MLFSTISVAGVACIVAAGFRADGYMLHVMRIPLPHPYPLGGVITMSIILVVELALTYAVIRPASYARSWGRALCATMLSALALLISAPMLMHAPLYFYLHSLILLFLTFGLVVVFVVSTVAAIRHRLLGG